MYARFIKRLLDIILSLLAIIILLPVLLILAILVRINLGFPIIFSQERVGKDEKTFIMYKFRSMTDSRDENGELLPDQQRQTKLGIFLRGTSLDELPELFNILKGDISIVGPRPLLMSYLPYYTLEERKRHNVRGGLTVPEVLHGNVNPTWEEQFSYEVDYVKNVSFLLDCKIILHTFLILFKRAKEDYGHEVRKPLNIERQYMVEDGEINVGTFN